MLCFILYLDFHYGSSATCAQTKDNELKKYEISAFLEHVISLDVNQAHAVSIKTLCHRLKMQMDFFTKLFAKRGNLNSFFCASCLQYKSA